MFPKIVLIIAIFALLSACSAPPAANPVPTETLPATLPPTSSQTLIPTSTSTPEPPATPEPTVIQKEITFDLTNGETLTMPGFLANFPEGATPEEIDKTKIELVEASLQFIVEDGIDWERTRGLLWDQTPQNMKDYVNQLKLIPGILPVQAFTVPYNNKDEKVDIFLLAFSSVQYNGNFGTLLKYYTDEGGYSAVFVEMNLGELTNLIKLNKVTIPQKPATP